MTRTLPRSTFAIFYALLGLICLSPPAQAEPNFKRIPAQFIAALGDPGATSGSNAQAWGIWRLDPGPRGVRLEKFEQLKAADGVTPDNWNFDTSDWWLEEHGLIMEKPDFPLPPGKYMVTGGREVTSKLTISAKANDGTQTWALDNSATLHDVTHLPCRSARYMPASRESACTPSNAQSSQFPVQPGAAMPNVEGCKKQDYAVLFVVAVGQEN